MITSKDNTQLKYARAVRDGKVPEQMFIEGLRLCEEAAGSGVSITAVFYTEEYIAGDRNKDLIVHLRSRGISPEMLSEKLLESIADTRSPQGIIILADRPANSSEALSAALKKNANGLPLVVVLNEMNNPSNVGAILRTAEAADAAGAVLTRGSADPFSPKGLRGAMGASLRMPVWYGVEYGEAIYWAEKNQLTTACADIGGIVSYTDIDWKKPHALIIGSEARGLDPEQIAGCDESFVIPMAKPAESLNAAVAAGIVLFEARRVALQ